MRAKPNEARRKFYELTAQQTDECILWPYSVNSTGYGQLGVDGVSTSVHVIACEMANGPRPEGQQAAHSCGTKRCVNLRHLRWATPAENEADKAVHGRENRGVRNGQVKLTEADVRVLRAAAKGGARRIDLAEVFGISTHHAAAIRDGEYWTHLTDDESDAA